MSIAAIARSNRAMRRAQIAYDGREPPEDYDWTDSSDCEQWLNEGKADLLARRDVWVGRYRVSAEDFRSEFASALYRHEALSAELEWSAITGQPLPEEVAARIREVAEQAAVDCLMQYAEEAERVARDRWSDY